MKKALSIILASILIASVASAMSFGSVVGDQERTIEGMTTTFNIAVMNLGEDPLQISFDVHEPEGADIILPDDQEMEPSITTENPGEYELDEDYRWFLLDDGEYVMVREFPVSLISDDHNANTFDFEVELSASMGEDPRNNIEEDYSTTQRVVQTRNYEFNVEKLASSPSEISEDEIEYMEQTDLESQDSSDSGFASRIPSTSEVTETARDTFDINFGDNEEEQDAGEDLEEFDEFEGETEEEDETTQSSSITGSFVEEVSSSPSTATLILGVLASFAYLIMVI